MRLRLLPESPLGWTPYAWLIYLSIFIVYGIVESKTPAHWAANGVALLVFLALYFRGFWLGGTRLLQVAMAIVGLGVVMSPVNSGASVFFVYGASFLGEALPPGAALRWVGIIAVVLGVESWLVPLPPQAWVPGIVFTLIIGGTNIHFGELRRKNDALLAARESARHMAVVVERERIARDLHDILGHTLSVIVLKSELASKLAERDPARAIAEIKDVEQISRNALQEVRRAIHGYRGERIEQELESGRLALQSAGVTLVASAAPAGVDPDTERALALALREAITNVIRHARARRCEITLERGASALALIIHDDGIGGTHAEGSGLSGMRARVAEVGGTVTRDGSRGTRLDVRVPLLRDIGETAAVS